MNKPKISIIIPAYNQAEYLNECIESALAQTYKPHEIIVVNDGSTDSTRYVAAEYPQVKYIEQVNKGLSSARNTGIMNMTGDWFYPLDSDDMMVENCLERVAYTIVENPDADIISPSFKCFGKGQDTIILMPNPQLNDFKFINGQPMNRVAYCSAVKKEALLEIGGYSPRMKQGWEDLHLWVNLLSRGKKIVTIPEVLMLYRTKDTSMWTESNLHATELTEQIFKDFPNFK